MEKNLEHMEIERMLEKLRTMKSKYSLGSEMRKYYNDVFDRMDVLSSKLLVRG